ncbi:MAG: hypothetical protein WC479_07450 [Candidatus Izemoplasmatales bacterium]
MANKQPPTNWLPKLGYDKKVSGLRCFVQPNPVKVFRMNPDGSMGEFLRTEQPPDNTIKRFTDYKRL